jgi:basic membrane protein A
MKKILALLLALALVLSLAACGAKKEEAKTETKAEPKVTDNADEVADNMTSSDGKYEIAFVTDVGQLKDKSFNQGTYDGVKLYANNNGKSYKYYQPANGDAATDDDRYDAMKSACDNGAKVVVAAGFMQGGAIERAAKDFPDTKFVFIDGWGMGLDNVVGIAFNEHECGYLAGYAVVKEGYEKLGFCGGGGGNNPACCRYGYGFVQGANAAAAEMGKQIEINYTWLYGASFSASPEMQSLTSGWYETGTEVIFAAGGSIFQSIAAAAAANDKFVVGVDVDQSYESDTVITSALKGVSEAASWAIGKAYDGSWASLNGFVSLGAADGAVGLPEATWSLKNYSVDEYKAQLADIVSGKLEIKSDVLENDAITTIDFSNTNVNYVA